MDVVFFNDFLYMFTKHLNLASLSCHNMFLPCSTLLQMASMLTAMFCITAKFTTMSFQLLSSSVVFLVLLSESYKQLNIQAICKAFGRIETCYGNSILEERAFRHFIDAMLT